MSLMTLDWHWKPTKNQFRVITDVNLYKPLSPTDYMVIGLGIYKNFFLIRPIKVSGV